ncbi:MAG: GLUG motif-containing protein, partial [Candidatus Cloacimonetes bacterium]|nr:GLUG motif-containing protein [Candidatus Cloacimonadota bacterium]
MTRKILLLLAMSLMIFSVYALEPLNFENLLPQTRTVYTAPYSQDFNSVASGYIPEGWSVDDNGEADPLPWQVRHSQACCFLNDYWMGQERSLWTPWIIIPGPQYRLNFKWSHGQRTDYNYDSGAVYVYVSETNYTKVWERFGTAFNSNDGYSISEDSIGSPGTGVSESIDLSRWAGQEIYILFSGTSAWGPAWYVDDFSVQYQDTSISTFPSTQTFAQSTFPPSYWSVPNTWDAPDLYAWQRGNSNAYGASGTGSALCSFEGCLADQQIALTTPYLNLGDYGGKLSYDYAYSPYLVPNANERLDIQYSLDYGITFTTLASYNAGTGGGMATAAPHSGAQWAPASTEWASRTLDIPPGTNQIRFLGTSAHSGRLYIDNVRFEKNYFAFGTGTQTDPFTVSNAKELNLIRNYPGSASSRTFFKLISDIDLDSYLTPGGEGYAAWGTNGWLPIGNDTSSMFYGGLDGDGHTISNLRTAYYGFYHGLFGMTAEGSTIKNLNLSSTCSILGDDDTGSIVGHNKGSIENCSSAAAVYIGNATTGGGICGNHNAGSITGCTFTGTVSRSAAGVTANGLGGIAGRNETGAAITNCSSTGTISGSTWCGGLVGWNNGTIDRSFTSGSISSYQNSNGGLVGQNQGSINNSYSHANVSGVDYIGGVVGNQGSTGSITNSYSTGTVSGGQKGGLLGSNGGSVISSYWDTQTSGQATSFGGTGKTTAQMKTQSTFTGWDFTMETTNGSNDYWNLSSLDNSGYPDLAWRYASQIKSPVLVSPANNAYGVSKDGFSLVWSPNPVGLVPDHYTIYLVKDDPAQIFNSEYPGQHTIVNLTGVSFNPVAEAGFGFSYGENWYWTVVAYSLAGTASPAPGTQSFHIQRDQFVTESFELGCIDGTSNISEWTLALETGSSPWTANSTYSGSLTPRTGDFNVYLFHSDGAPAVSWLFHPITLVGSRTYDVELYARQQSTNPNNAQMGIYYGTDPTIAAMTNSIAGSTFLDTSEYKRIAGSFTPSSSGTYYLGIRGYIGGSTNYLALDDVKLSITAPNPVTLNSPLNQATFVNTLASLSWTAPAAGIPPSSYKLCVSTVNPPTLANLSAVVEAPATSFTLLEASRLQPSTTYYWSVIAEAQGEHSPNNAVYSFVTLPEGAFTEGFESGAIPGGWTVLNLDGGTQSWSVSNINVITGALSACIYAESSCQNDDWLISPRLGGSEIVPDNFRFSLRKIYSNYPEEFEVLVSTTDTQPASFTAIGSSSIPDLQVFSPNYNLDSFGGALIYLAIRYRGNNENGIWLDDVFGPPLYTSSNLDIAATSITGPSAIAIARPYDYTVGIQNNGFALQSGYTVYLKCQSPEATLASFAMPALGGYASTTHTFSWTPDAIYVGTANLYAEVALPGDTVPANDISPSLAVTITPWEMLNEGFESGIIPANWTVLNADPGLNQWSISTGNIAHTGSHSIQVWYEDNLESNDWIITPPLMLSASRVDTISFWMNGNYSDPWEVLVSTTDTNPASFTMIDSGLANSTWNQKTYNLDAYGNAVVYVAIRAWSFDLFALWLDDFVGPPIYTPGGLLDTPNLCISSSNSDFTLSWDSVAGATEYHVYSSEDLVNWSPSYINVTAPDHTLSINTATSGRIFFKVVACNPSSPSTSTNTQTDLMKPQ